MARGAEPGEGLPAGFRIRRWGSAGELHTRESTSLSATHRNELSGCGQTDSIVATIGSYTAIRTRPVKTSAITGERTGVAGDPRLSLGACTG